MYVPVFIQKLFGSVTWRIPCAEPTLFLTFDDGPVPEVTPHVLRILESYNAKATFFCLGDNVEKHRDLYEKILSEGHVVGNHTSHHLNGWKVSLNEYLKDVALCDKVLSLVNDQHSTVHSPQSKVNSSNLVSDLLLTADRRPSTKIFRPPYGKLSWSQYDVLSTHYTIVMWDLLSRDYDQSLTGEACFQKVVDHATSGSIVVFHDSVKAKARVLDALPKVLEYFSKKNYLFRAINK